MWDVLPKRCSNTNFVCHCNTLNIEVGIKYTNYNITRAALHLAIQIWTTKDSSKCMMLYPTIQWSFMTPGKRRASRQDRLPRYTFSRFAVKPKCVCHKGSRSRTILRFFPPENWNWVCDVLVIYPSSFRTPSPPSTNSAGFVSPGTGGGRGIRLSLKRSSARLSISRRESSDYGGSEGSSAKRRGSARNLFREISVGSKGSSAFSFGSSGSANSEQTAPVGWLPLSFTCF